MVPSLQGLLEQPHMERFRSVVWFGTGRTGTLVAPTLVGNKGIYHMSCNLNSLKGGYIGDYIGDYHRAF